MQTVGYEQRIQSTPERVFLIIWCLFTLTASLLGDTVILVATLRYKAIQMHKVVIAVMQHLAISDLLQTVFRVLPTTLVLLSDEWRIGEVTCHIQSNIYFFNAIGQNSSRRHGQFKINCPNRFSRN